MRQVEREVSFEGGSRDGYIDLKIVGGFTGLKGDGERTAGGIQLRLPNRTGRLIFLHTLPAVDRRPISHTMIGAIKPIRKAQTSGRYKASSPKNRWGPTTPHRMLPLKCTRAIGQVKPLMASGVQILGT